MIKDRMAISKKDVQDLAKLTYMRILRDKLHTELSGHTEFYSDDQLNSEIASLDTKIRFLEETEYRVLGVLHLFHCEIQRVQRGDRFATEHEMESMRGAGTFEIFTGDFAAAQQALASMLSN